MPQITSRSLTGVDGWYPTRWDSMKASGDISPTYVDNFGSLLTLPYVFNYASAAIFMGSGDEDYRDYYHPLMSYSKYGYLAVEMPGCDDGYGYLNVNIANIDPLATMTTTPPVHDEYANETILIMGDHYDAHVSTSAPIVTVDAGHHAIHNSECYVATHVLTAANVGEKINIYIKTPSIVSEQTMIHVYPRWSCKDIARFTLWEASTYVTSGTGTGNNWSWNKNLYEGAGITSKCVDNSSPAPLSGCYSRDVTINGGGNPIIQYSVGPKPIGGSDRDVDEWVLNPSEPYVFELESLVNSNFLYLELVWYEHTTAFSV